MSINGFDAEPWADSGLDPDGEYWVRREPPSGGDEADDEDELQADDAPRRCGQESR